MVWCLVVDVFVAEGGLCAHFPRIGRFLYISDILLMKFAQSVVPLGYVHPHRRTLEKGNRRKPPLSRVKFRPPSSKVEAQGPLDGVLHAASLVMGSFEVWSPRTDAPRWGC